MGEIEGASQLTENLETDDVCRNQIFPLGIGLVGDREHCGYQYGTGMRVRWMIRVVIVKRMRKCPVKQRRVRGRGAICFA